MAKASANKGTRAKNGNGITKEKTAKAPVITPPVSEEKRRVKSSDPKIVAKEIQDLLKELGTSTDSEEKKRIRRNLRARGHFGGLGKGKGRPKKETAKTNDEEGIEEDETEGDE